MAGPLKPLIGNTTAVFFDQQGPKDSPGLSLMSSVDTDGLALLKVGNATQDHKM